MQSRSYARGFLIAVVAAALVQPLTAQQPVDKSSIHKDAPMAANADPSFEIAMIRPSDPNDPKAQDGWNFESEGHRIGCRQATVLDILSVVYGVQTRQIVGGPAWMSKDRYDISGVPDVPGTPNGPQLEAMYKKLLAERFHLVLHNETREMPIYAITVTKGGPQLQPADPKRAPNTGNSTDSTQRTLRFRNQSMKDLAHNLDFYEDRPVVDQTSLPGRYDFTLRWTYEPSAEDRPGAPPPLPTALREQLGLKMEAVKGPAEVLVVDRLERPTEN